MALNWLFPYPLITPSTDRRAARQVRRATSAVGWEQPHNTLLLNVVSLLHTAVALRADLSLLLHAAGIHPALLRLAQHPGG